MNIKINKEQHDYLMTIKVSEHLMGSCLYGTDVEGSDKDMLMMYSSLVKDKSSQILTNNEFRDCMLPNIHQFQYTENNVDYIWTSESQFWKNQMSGDSTINSDLILFGDICPEHMKLNYCRTYKIIKAYIGFANRDLKNIKGRNKLFHAYRSLYTADCLLKNTIPEISEIQKISLSLTEIKSGELQKHLREWCKELRLNNNTLYESGKLQNYYVNSNIPFDEDFGLRKLLLGSNNTKEFRYV